jgi:hypothetical protein
MLWPGSPLETRKRRWQNPITVAFLVSVPVAIAFLITAVVLILSSDESCWSNGNRSTPAHYMISGIAWEVFQP